MAEKLVPITRLGKFFGGEDFDLDISMGREWLGGDMNFTIVLYKVDRTKTVQDAVYGEVLQDGIQFLPPVSINAYVRIEEAAEQFLGQSKIIQNEPGLLKFAVYKQELADLQVNIELGDYIGLQKLKQDTIQLLMLVFLTTTINTHTVGIKVFIILILQHLLVKTNLEEYNETSYNRITIR